MRDLLELDAYRMRDVERRAYGVNGDSGNGCFRVYVNGRSFNVIASNGGGWDHVSVSPNSAKRKVCPTWEEMSAIKDMFFLPNECVVEYHPPKTEYVNNHPYCLHLWRPNNGVLIAAPPGIFVGLKHVTATQMEKVFREAGA